MEARRADTADRQFVPKISSKTGERRASICVYSVSCALQNVDSYHLFTDVPVELLKAVITSVNFPKRMSRLPYGVCLEMNRQVFS